MELEIQPVWSSICWPLHGLGVVENSGRIFNLIYILMRSFMSRQRHFEALTSLVCLLPLLLEFVVLSGNTIQALPQSRTITVYPWKREM